MAAKPVLYYITDRRAFPGTETRRRLHLLLKIAEAARAGVNYIQLREKDMQARELELLARDAVKAIHDNSTSTKLLINSRTDFALVSGADGVHLRSHDLSPGDVRRIVRACKSTEGETNRAASPFLIAVSCHNAEDVSVAANNGADFVVFAPVFEKKDSPTACPAGLTSLAHTCRASIPVLALGGITLRNARACLDAGAAGIAAIRLFQENEIGGLVRQLRAL